MKKVIALLALLLVLTSSSAFAQTAFPSFVDFEGEFEYASILTGSEHYFKLENLTIDTGEYSTVYTISFNSTLGMLITVPNNTESISEVMLLYVSDGTNASALDFMYGIGELAIATGAISAVDQIWDFLGLVGILDNLEDGASNSITIGNLKYSYMMYTSLGIFFYVSEID